jgi:tetratricopeptide (TPR) repeat protein
MFAVRRLLAVGSVLTLIGLLATASLWGRMAPRGKSPLDSTDASRPNEVVAYDPHAVEEMSLSRFADRSVLLYHRADRKETLLALQVKPKLKPVASLPRDYLLLLDTAAHMAGADWKSLQVLTEKFVGKLGAGDRVSMWTVNTRPHELTKGFQSAKEAVAALKKLESDYPSGAVNLRDALPQVLKTFDGKKDRQRAIVFLGSGQSIAGPIDADLRASLCKDMIANQIAFYSVPMGGYLDPYNLHGLANGTGGKVVRFGLGSTPETWCAKLLEAISQPILYDAQIKLPARIVEVMPSKLPPIRPDVPVLVVARFGGEPAMNEPPLEYTLSGACRGEAVRLTRSEKMPPADDENYFLVNMFDQWKERKDRPSLLQADRALAYAFETNQLARADLIAQAEWALEKKKFDAAQRLYERALQADPTSTRAIAGLQLVRDLRSGKKTLDEVKKLLEVKKGDIVRYKKVDEKWGGNFIKQPVEQIFADPDKKEQPIAPDQAEKNRLNDVKARQAVVDQEQTGIVNEAIRQANRMVVTRPDDAHEFLKRTLDGVRTNPDISLAKRAALSDQLERALQNVDIRGAVVRRDQDEGLRLMANANARTTLNAQERLEQDRVRERMRVYHNLMNQAREKQAYIQAQSIRRDLIDQGLPVPPAVTGAYITALAGYHLREERELKRIRQERWLNVLLEVERSHIPFPDEPPVEFPPAAQWRALSEMRKARYESATFGADMPTRGLELRQELSKVVKFDGIDDARATLSDALDLLSKRYNLSFDINDTAFKIEMVPEVGKLEIAQTPIPPMQTTLANVLRKILRRISPQTQTGATFLIRRDQIEITTGAFAGAEKTVRVYPAADLVIPIPNAINTSMLMASSTLFGMSAGALGGFAGVGGLGGMGLRGIGMAGIGGVAGMAGMGGMNLGGLGGVGGIAGLGGQGFNQLGAQGGFQGNFQGGQNNGMGGIVGFGGQALGQFGNLGGQFGLQGGNQSNILINLIRQVVGKPGDWGPYIDFTTGQPVNPLDEEKNPEGLNKEYNQLGFFPPAMALAVKGTSTIHTRASNLIIPPAAQMGALPGKRDPKVQVAGNGEERPDPFDPKLDPRTIWQNALSNGVNNPGLIIATADFLVLRGKFDHAVEFLKANLRQGIVVQPWVYQSLALALRMAGGSTEDIERAEVSTADMEPNDAGGFLQAAPSLAREEKFGLALAFCRQAALVQPGTAKPYAEALNYAELSRDPQAMQWAAGNLLSHDWPVDNRKMQDLALQKVDSLVALLDKEGRKEDAERLRNSVSGKRVRDLVVKLNWQGDADLDLHVVEPTGSLCSPLHRQTVGGGVMIGDSLADMTNETYLAAEAFSGDYEIEVEKVWGHPLGGKAQLKIIRHQGTPDEHEELLTVELKSHLSERIKIKLDGGRRMETAYVPPPSAHRSSDADVASVESQDKVLFKLRAMADPEVTGVGRGVSGGVASQGIPVMPSALKSGRADTTLPSDDRTLYQTRVKPFVQNALDVTASAVLSADRRSVRLSMTPVFNTVTGVQTAPVVVNPTIPGAR